MNSIDAETFRKQAFALLLRQYEFTRSEQVRIRFPHTIGRRFQRKAKRSARSAFTAGLGLHSAVQIEPDIGFGDNRTAVTDNLRRNRDRKSTRLNSSH